MCYQGGFRDDELSNKEMGPHGLESDFHFPLTLLSYVTVPFLVSMGWIAL